MSQRSASKITPVKGMSAITSFFKPASGSKTSPTAPAASTSPTAPTPAGSPPAATHAHTHTPVGTASDVSSSISPTLVHASPPSSAPSSAAPAAKGMSTAASTPYEAPVRSNGTPATATGTAAAITGMGAAAKQAAPVKTPAVMSDSDDDVPLSIVRKKAAAAPAASATETPAKPTPVPTSTQKAPTSNARASSSAKSNKGRRAVESDGESEFSASPSDEDEDEGMGSPMEEDDEDGWLEDDTGGSRKRGKPAGAAAKPRARATPSSRKKGSPAAAKASPSAAGTKRGRDDADALDAGNAHDDVAADARPSGVLGAGQHAHNAWKWLTTERRDAAGRRPTDPGYNPRTLMVPRAFFDDQTPAAQQWWTFKAQNVDTILFFKQGKFYETFHMDADVCVRELGLIYMKGEQAHAGFPEISYGYFSERLVALGYRVARVEQTETPAQLAERNKVAPKGVKKDRVVAREMCAIKTKGTRTFNHMDAFSGATAQASDGSETPGTVLQDVTTDSSILSTGNYLYAVKEIPLASADDMAEYSTEDGLASPKVHDAATGAATSAGFVRLGIVVADCATGDVRVAEFVDDKMRTRLRTLLARFPPAEYLYARDEPAASGARGLTVFTKRILKYDAPAAVHNTLAPTEEFWTAKATAERLGLVASAAGAASVSAAQDYFAVDAEAASARLPSATTFASLAAPIRIAGPDGTDRDVPETVWEMVQRARAAGFDEVREQGDALATEATDLQPSCLALSSFGALVWYLRRCLIDHPILSLRRVARYMHADGLEGCLAFANASPVPTKDVPARGEGGPGVRHMALDGTTILNLDLLENSADGGRNGTLFALLDTCVTPFGRRRLKQWICAPLLDPMDIEDRLKAVDELMPCISEVVAEVRAKLKGLPDMERLLARVHTLGSKVMASAHPDGRAIFYEADVYNKRKIADLLTALNSFNAINSARDLLHDASGHLIRRFTCPLLRRAMHDSFPELKPLLAFFSSSFDAAQAAKQNKITPARGVDSVYDAAVDEVTSIEQDLQAYLQEQKRALACSALAYWGTAKDRFQIEVPEAIAERVPREYSLKSKRAAGKGKGVFRYWTPRIESLLARLTVAEDKREAAAADALRRIFVRFDAHREQWEAAVSAIATLDCLFALSTWSARGDGGVMCRPQVVAPSQEGAAFTHLSASRHPCLTCATSDSFIPNDIQLGDSGASAASCILLTGPNMGGKSTLLRQTCIATILAQMGCYVPAEECKLTPVDRIFTRVGASDRILAGQSTFFVELAETSTILNQATRNSLVILDELGRGTSTFDGNAIAYAVTKHLTTVLPCRTMFATHYHTLCDDFTNDPRVALGHMDCIVEQLDDGTSRVTFLYKYANGACPKSYGLNVARLARLPESVIRRAHEKSEEFEAAVEAAAGKGSASAGTARARVAGGTPESTGTLGSADAVTHGLRQCFAKLQQGVPAEVVDSELAKVLLHA